jgi:D-alanine transaminase
LSELDMTSPITSAALADMFRELVRLNDIDQGMIYLQITRGNPGDRSFVFPDASLPATIVAFTQNIPNLADAPAAQTGFKVISVPDMRWGRVDIKTTQLLYPSMAKMMAKKAGVDDSWFVADDGCITEGTSNNAYIVKGNRIITRQLSTDILHGITRASVLRFAAEAQFEVEERPFTVAEAQAADEAFSTAASIFVMPVVEVDGKPVGAGTPGPVAKRLREIYLDEMRKTAI